MSRHGAFTDLFTYLQGLDPRCQNILGPIFPNLRQEFENSRRYLDVVRFVNDVLNCDVGGPTSRGPLRSLSTFQATAPIKIIDSVLAENPTSIIAGLPDWGNAHFSERSNQDIALYFANLDSCEPSEVTFDASNLPPPPALVTQEAVILVSQEEQFSCGTRRISSCVTRRLVSCDTRRHSSCVTRRRFFL